MSTQREVHLARHGRHTSDGLAGGVRSRLVQELKDEPHVHRGVAALPTPAKRRAVRRTR